MIVLGDQACRDHGIDTRACRRSQDRLAGWVMARARGPCRRGRCRDARTPPPQDCGPREAAALLAPGPSHLEGDGRGAQADGLGVPGAALGADVLVGAARRDLDGDVWGAAVLPHVDALRTDGARVGGVEGWVGLKGRCLRWQMEGKGSAQEGAVSHRSCDMLGQTGTAYVSTSVYRHCHIH